MRFLDRRDAEDAMDSLDGRKYDGREIRIQMEICDMPKITCEVDMVRLAG